MRYRFTRRARAAMVAVAAVLGLVGATIAPTPAQAQVTSYYYRYCSNLGTYKVSWNNNNPADTVTAFNAFFNPVFGTNAGSGYTYAVSGFGQLRTQRNGVTIQSISPLSYSGITTCT